MCSGMCVDMNNLNINSTKEKLKFSSFLLETNKSTHHLFRSFSLISVACHCVMIICYNLSGQCLNIRWVYDTHSNCKIVCCKTD